MSMTGSNKFAIDHLGIAVKSIDEALRFYRDALGLSVEHRETVALEKVNAAMLAALALAGATEVYRIGGAHAVAALAFGTKTIRPAGKRRAQPAPNAQRRPIRCPSKTRQ